MSDHSGFIVTNAARFYYLPSNATLRPLRWVPEQQRFLFLDDSCDEDVAVCATLEDLVAGLCTSPAAAASTVRVFTRGGGEGGLPSNFADGTSTAASNVIMSGCISCRALYGVLPIGSCDSVLLYVSGDETVGALLVGEESHEVRRVSKMEWLRLPSRSPPASCAAARVSQEEANTPTGAAGDHTPEEEPDEDTDRIAESTMQEYLRVVDRFCMVVSGHGTGRIHRERGVSSFLYYSPTINLSLSPSELMLQHSSAEAIPSELSVPSPGTTTGFFASREGLSRHLFQWNHALQEQFVLPTYAVLCGLSPENHSRTFPAGSTEEEEEGQQQQSLEYQQRALALYVPSFIRGLFSQEKALTSSQKTSRRVITLTLVTRLCCKWSGTRYNRRGLAPGGSGVVANMAVSSLWVCETARPAREDVGVGSPQRVAVYETLRGSIPRRWEQPANLTFKPPIRISPPVSGGDELCGHLRLLQAFLPDMKAVLCLDTTSLSKLEKPLSEAFEQAVRRVQEEAATAGNNGGRYRRYFEDVPQPQLWYLKCNIKKAMKGRSYFELKTEVIERIKDVLVKSESDVKKEEEDATETHHPRWSDYTCFELTPLQSSDGGSTSIGNHWRRASQQSFYIRVNCLDCLDRTNLTQSLLTGAVLASMIRYVLGCSSGGDTACAEGEDGTESAKALLRLYAEQGVALSQLYASSEPHFLSYMLRGRETLASKLHGGRIALRRWYRQNFYDGMKQDMVSLLTRQHDPNVFNSDIESPFSRDLSSMNWQVVYGLLLCIAPLLYTVVVACLSNNMQEKKMYSVIVVGWIIFLVEVVRKLKKYSVTYTNRPLLSVIRG